MNRLYSTLPTESGHLFRLVKIVGLAAAILTSGMGAFAGTPNEDAATRKTLQTVYSGYDKAALKGMQGVEKWYEENLSPDYTIVLLDGNTYPRKLYLDMIDRIVKNPPPTWKDVKSQKTQIKKLDSSGSDVVAVIEIETTFASNAPKRPRVCLEKSYRETWTKVGEAWRVKKSEEIEVKPKPVEKPAADQKRVPDQRRQQNRGAFPATRPGMGTTYPLP